MTSRQRTLYDRLGGRYDLLASAGEAQLSRQGLDLLNPQPGQSVLELGCGTGQNLLHLTTRVGKSGMAVGIDLSPAMLQAARKLLRKRHSTSAPSLIHGDALRLPFPDQSYDAIFASFLLELFPDEKIPQVLAEVQRVLRPEGKLCAVSLGLHEPVSMMTRLYRRLHHAYPAVLDCHPIPLPALLLENGFMLEKVTTSGIWGLSVDVILAVSSW